MTEFLVRNTQELQALWNRLEEKGHKKSDPCRECGENWQYMGPSITEGLQTFRHRCGRGHAMRLYVELS